MVKAVRQALSTARGEPVYLERAQQAFQAPGFIVAVLPTFQSKADLKAYRTTERIQITWVPNPSSEDKRAACLLVGRQLFEVLELLPTEPTPTRTQNAEYEVVEDELIFTFDVIYRVTLTEEP